MSTELETLEKPASVPLQQGRYQITQANASALAQKSLQARRLKAKEHAEYIAKLEQEASKAREIILAHAIATAPVPTVEPDERYRLEQLKRVREAIEQLWKELSTAEDAKERQAIATAIEKMSNMEFNLAKRPKPAAYRTAPEKPTKRSSVVEPED